MFQEHPAHRISAGCFYEDEDDDYFSGATILPALNASAQEVQPFHLHVLNVVCMCPTIPSQCGLHADMPSHCDMDAAMPSQCDLDADMPSHIKPLSLQVVL